MTTLLLVDDHAIVHQGLIAILDREPDLQVVGQAGTAAEGLAAVTALQPDLVVLDLRLGSAGEAGGLRLCEQIVALRPQTGVLILSTFVDSQLVIEAVRRGARGYVVKDVDTSSLVRAIRIVADGGRAFDAKATSAMAGGLGPGKQAVPELSDREQDVLELLVQGLSNQQIAERLFISVTTVKFHVSNVLRKLGVTRRAEVAYVASRWGLSAGAPGG